MKILIDILTKHKKKTLTSLLFVIALYVLQAGVDYFKTEIIKIKSLEVLEKSNEIRLSDLEYKTNYYDDLIKTIVTRTSFDNYILRKDNELQEQAGINMSLVARISKIDGRVNGLENIVYSLHEFQLYKDKKK
jgi:hypothetical protein